MHLKDFIAKKLEQQKFSSLTAYDATFARLIADAGVDLILVGDSLGNVIKGENTTNGVTIEEIVYHSKIVSKGIEKSINNPYIVADIPFLSDSSVKNLLKDCKLLFTNSQVQMVKLEVSNGMHLDFIKALSDRGIAVCAHLGLLPQSFHKYGYKTYGKEQIEQEDLLTLSYNAVSAGASMLLLESVDAAIAGKITKENPIPVIGIGAGNEVDGQILVCYDVLGISEYIPKFASQFIDIRESSNLILNSFKSYHNAVINQLFP